MIGVHYTPDALADELVAVALEPHMSIGAEGLTVVDLACGDGALIAAAQRRLEQQARSMRVKYVGVDIDPGAVESCRKRLPGADIRLGDGLFDAAVSSPPPLVFVGNPPFLGGLKISGALGADYRKKLAERYPTFRGTADLCACFLLAAAASIQRSGELGTMSFITTNTICQGDTRKAGLATLMRPNSTGVWSVWHAWRSRPWPGDAKVNISIVHLANERMGRLMGFGTAIDRVYRDFGKEPRAEAAA